MLVIFTYFGNPLHTHTQQVLSDLRFRKKTPPVIKLQEIKLTNIRVQKALKFGKAQVLT